MSRHFTGRSHAVPLNYLDEAFYQTAYLAYFFPVNVAKVQELLDELRPTFAHPSHATYRVLDLGCGLGTGVIGVVDWIESQGLLKHGNLECVAIDRSARALDASKSLWRSYMAEFAPGRHTLQLAHHDLEGGLCSTVKQAAGSGGYDIIIMANVLSELFQEKPSRIDACTELLMAVLDLLAEHGTVMLIEPALRESSRALHEVRDRLLQAGVCTIYSPCLHEGACPALSKATDWCHEERAWSPPALIRAIDKEVGFIKDALKFSYALLRKDGQTVVRRQPSMYRMVSELRTLKGETRAWVCNEWGRHEIGRLDKDRSETNRAFEQATRGAIITINSIVRKEKKGRKAMLGRIPPAAVVELIGADTDADAYSASGSVPP